MNEHLNTDRTESNQTKLERSQGAGQICIMCYFALALILEEL